ncbi:MAG TPA: FecR domain-containing protein [Rhizomicrobium sp.]|jgi:transmembrane sensor|nr:FecR domain-containing protein [Rhizomicrobium sp.]
MSSASEIESIAANWLERHGNEGWNDALDAELQVWLAEAYAHRAAYWRLKAAWNQAERLAALKSVSNEYSVEAPRNSKKRPLILRMAAACAAVVVLSVAAKLYFSEAEPRLYATAVGERKTLTLGDGSKIELNTDTRLRIAADDARKVWLDRGEAYFEIKHDEAHPFYVIAGSHRVVDLGTKFLIRQDAARTEVALIQGRARFESRVKAEILTPGDIAYATAEAMSVRKRPARTLVNALGWRHGVIIFDRTTLADAAAELNRYNTKQIVILDPAAARLTIHGRFPSNDTSAIVNVAQDVFGLRVEHHGNEILISR